MSNTKAAYLFAVIDIPSRQITRCAILSERWPAAIGYAQAYALLHTTSGVDFADAHKNMQKEIRSNPFFQWTYSLLDKRHR